MPFSNAKWICGDVARSAAPRFRRSFSAMSPVRAEIAVCGLGFFELYCNGRRVSDDLLVPAWSDYEPRPNRRMLYPINDSFSHRIYYLVYDLTKYLRGGDNVIGVVLGNGWYNQRRRNVEGDFYYGTPKLVFSLKITDSDGEREIVSDGATRVSSGCEIVENNVYSGEVHDLRLRDDAWTGADFDDSDWDYAALANAPRSPMFRQTCPTDKVIREIIPRKIGESDGRTVYDCGENITGFAVIKTPAQSGLDVTVRYAEELHGDSSLDFTSTGGDGQIQFDIYTCADKSYVCYPHFCVHGFRYFDVEGAAEVLRVDVIHADVKKAEDFRFTDLRRSDPDINWLCEAYVRTQLANLHCGVPSDCPHRERLGYTGDAQITARAAMMLFDMREFYKKYMADIADCQAPNGHVQHTAPFYGGGGGPGGWGGAVFIIPTEYHRVYGDELLLREYYPNMRRWLDYMESRTADGLVVREENDGWCLGDWCAPNLRLSEPFVNTYYYIKGLAAVKNAADLLVLPAESELADREIRCKTALTAAYYDEKSGSFCGGANGADAFAIDIGLGGERVKSALIRRYSAMSAPDTGIFGTPILTEALFELGEGALAVRLIKAAFAKMRAAGATTLWETLDGSGSHSHPMFGGVVAVLAERLGNETVLNKN